MYKILEEDVMLRIGGKWYSTTAVLTGVSGGKQVNFVDADGNILKSQAFSRSKYSNVAKAGDGFGDEKSVEEAPEKPRLSDPDFMAKMAANTKQLRDLGLEG